MAVLAALAPDYMVVSVRKADPHVAYRCCGCNGRMRLAASGDEFVHLDSPCRNSKWKHDYAVDCIARKDTGTVVVIPGATTDYLCRIETVPRMEAQLNNPNGKMSTRRRVDVGFRARLYDNFSGAPIGPVGPLAIEVRHKHGKDARFVNDMKAIALSVVEFDLGAMLRSNEYDEEDRDELQRIAIWVNTGSSFKRWLHAERPFAAAYNKWRAVNGA